MGQVYLKKGDKAAAIQSLERSVKKAPGFFAALRDLGGLYILTNQFPMAIQAYAKAAGVKKDAGVLMQLGILAEKTGNNTQAERYYRDVITYFPDYFYGYNQLAWLYAKQGINLDKAMELSQKADKLLPGNASIIDTIGWIEYQKKDYDKAVKNLLKANSIMADKPEVLYHIGATYYAMGKKKDAKPYLARSLALAKDFEGSREARKLLQGIR